MWHPACKLTEVAEGGSKVLELNGVSIALFKKEGKVYAIDSVCPHRGGPLGEGHLDGAELICPWHAWTFDITTGRCLSIPEVEQKTFPVKIEKDQISIQIE